ncbi:MAG: low molecular weight phosphotyrosine protein phosphatase, partial [Usitatibacter sp.]
MRSVLFVCTANICRSPMAEGVFRKILAEAGIDKGCQIDSVGTHDYHVGEPPFPAAVA